MFFSLRFVMAIIKPQERLGHFSQAWVAGSASHPGPTPALDGCTGLHGRSAHMVVWAARWAAQEKQPINEEPAYGVLLQICIL